MRMWLRLGAGVGVVGMLVAGCSSGPLPNATVSEFCQSKAMAECQVAVSCGVTTDVCVSFRQEVCVTSANQETMSGTRAYAQPNAAACIQAVQMAYAPPSQTITFATLQAVDSTCQEVFPGDVMTNGSCQTDYDCVNACPADALATTCEVCSPEVPGSTKMICAFAQPNIAQGMPCANVGSVCDTGTYCTGVPATCQPGGMAAAGQTCTPPAVMCAAGEYCQLNGGATSGKCIAMGSVGSVCTTDANCAATAPYCDLNVPPTGGSSTEGTCQTGLFSSFATDEKDCKAFGAN